MNMTGDVLSSAPLFFEPAPDSHVAWLTATTPPFTDSPPQHVTTMSFQPGPTSYNSFAKQHHPQQGHDSTSFMDFHYDPTSPLSIDTHHPNQLEYSLSPWDLNSNFFKIASSCDGSHHHGNGSFSSLNTVSTSHTSNDSISLRSLKYETPDYLVSSSNELQQRPAMPSSPLQGVVERRQAAAAAAVTNPLQRQEQQHRYHKGSETATLPSLLWADMLAQQQPMMLSGLGDSLLGPVQITTAPRGQHPCGAEGCKKVFKRAEHRKRHYDVAHAPHKSISRCPFCPKTFVNRPDNYRQHLGLHADEKRKGETCYRVMYDEGAAAELRKENEKTRPKKKLTSRAKVAKA